MSLEITEKDDDGDGVSRRTVLKSMAIAAAGAGVGGSQYFTSTGSAADAPTFEEEEVSTACWIGKQDCTMRAKVVNDRVVQLRPEPNDEVIDGICPKGVSQIADLYDPYRIKQPLKRVNDKGGEGEFQAISWEEAAEEIGDDLTEKLQDDPRRVHFQIGRVKGAEWHMGGWVGALEEEYGEGINVRGHGNVCATGNKIPLSRMGAGFSSPEPDFDNCEFFLNWGWNATNAGGPHLCNVTYSNEMAKGYESGMDVAVLDPQRRGSGQWCDDWLPIEPGTDLAFFLAMTNVLVEEEYVDEWFLRNNTNAPCLVYTEGPNEGEIARADDMDELEADSEDPVESALWCEGELVFDPDTGEIVPHEEALPDDPSDPTQDGSAALRPGPRQVDGWEVRSAFELLEEHVEEYTPEWAAEITDLPADQIRNVATKWGEEARIGATTTVELDDGTTRTVPYRPVAMSLYHVSQQELGPAAAQAGYLPMFLVGAIEVPGASRSGYFNAPDPGPREQVRSQAFDPDENLSWDPDGPDLEGTYFHPDANGAFSKTPHVLNNADDYNLPYGPEESTCIVTYANPVAAGPNRERSREGYSRYDTVVAVDPFMSDTANYCADYVLPTTTVDKNENAKGGMSNTHYTTSTRTAPIPQLFECRDEGDIFKELAAEAGAGDAYLENINDAFDVNFNSIDELTVEECIDQSFGEEFHDSPESEERPMYERYWFLFEEGDNVGDEHRTEYSPFGFKWQLYLESFELLGENVRDAFEDEYGADAEEQFPYIQDINGYAEWREPTMWDSPEEYELTLFDMKQIEYKQSRSAQNPLLNEIAPKNHVRMNPRDAAEIGVTDGDRVVVESHNAVTDDTYQIEGDVMTLEGIKPGTVAIPYGNDGHSAHPNVKALDEGANPNDLFDSTEGYCSWAADQSFHIRVNVEPAGGDSA